MDALVTALERLGYKLESESGLSKIFIRPPFHLFVTLRSGHTYVRPKTRHTATLRLNMDIPNPLPKSKEKGIKIRNEYEAIVDTYKQVKAEK